MSTEQIFNTSTVLKFLEVKIDDVIIHQDEIISLEFKQDFFDFGIFGSMKIKDSFDLTNNGLVEFNASNKIVVSITDFSGEKSKRTYRIIKTKPGPAADRFKVLDFYFVDEITFILKNSYLSKGFAAKPIDALVE